MDNFLLSCIAGMSIMFNILIACKYIFLRKDYLHLLEQFHSTPVSTKRCNGKYESMGFVNVYQQDSWTRISCRPKRTKGSAKYNRPSSPKSTYIETVEIFKRIEK